MLAGVGPRRFGRDDGRILDAMVRSTDKDESLKRLGGGRWQTRDERFTIEPQSGTWAVVDAEQTDDLGLALVRGPFGSLGAAKEAIGTAREAGPAASPLAARIRVRRDRPTDEPTRPTKRTKPNAPAGPGAPAKPNAPAEPRWLRDLAPTERRRVKRLMERLANAGASDPEGLVRRDIVGKLPAVAAFAIARAITALGDDASPADVAGLLAEGRDVDLGVRWRLVDDEDRTIALDLVEPGRPRRGSA